MEARSSTTVMGVVGVAVIGGGTFLLHGGGPPPAPAPPVPLPTPQAMMNSSLKYSLPVYRALLEHDAKQYKVPVPRDFEWTSPNGYFEELTTRRRVRPKQPLETPHLRISLEVGKQRASLEGQAFAMDHLILRIENRTPQYLAYRVETAVLDKRKCASKGEIPHNALVIEPNQILLRSECLYRPDESVDVMRVEVIELQPLSGIYVSRLPPNPLLIDARTGAGHVPLAGGPCPQAFSWREIQDGFARRVIAWRDVIDFYARHNCDEYSFFPSYRYRVERTSPLPARDLD